MKLDRERLARFACGDSDPDARLRGVPMWHIILPTVDALLADIAAQGFAIVPVEPTEWMIDAAHEAVDAYWNYNGDGRPGGPEGVYAAMLSAAKGDV